MTLRGATPVYVLATIIDYDVSRIVIEMHQRRRILHVFSSKTERGGTVIVCIPPRGGYIPYAVYKKSEYVAAIAEFLRLQTQSQ
jgi:hypothetical protein